MDLKPNLIEPGTKYFLRNTLAQCKIFRDKHINFAYNVGLAIIFFIILIFMILISSFVCYFQSVFVVRH